MKLQADSEWYIAAAGCLAMFRYRLSLTTLSLLCLPMAAIALVAPMPAAAAAMLTGASYTLVVQQYIRTMLRVVVSFLSEHGG